MSSVKYPIKSPSHPSLLLAIHKHTSQRRYYSSRVTDCESCSPFLCLIVLCMNDRNEDEKVESHTAFSQPGMQFYEFP
ncbi:hypothetical protein BofuT4_P156690.1 [Botrytis cinerea T4]|uniref:Uncharacterized protein n=1 Tax=Botryotinia fuckeliana (strain T4) TaxID=999810 RepID=G2YUH5_BOTF4|nr:hypothetical protein BofuT4_P156690.1 [Botrytis cinerea T4]